MKFSNIALAGVVVLGACDSGGSSERRQPIVVRSEAQNQLHQLNDLNRAIGLKRAILASGMRCRRVTRSGYVQEHNNLSLWMANCDDRTDYSIFVGPDGSAQVRRCSEHVELKLPPCVIKDKARAPTAPAS
jgi:hypothetical protein